MKALIFTIVFCLAKYGGGVSHFVVGGTRWRGGWFLLLGLFFITMQVLFPLEPRWHRHRSANSVGWSEVRMAQWSKFIGAPSRNEFWEPQEGVTFVQRNKSKQKYAFPHRSESWKITAIVCLNWFSLYYFCSPFPLSSVGAYRWLFQFLLLPRFLHFALLSASIYSLLAPVVAIGCFSWFLWGGFFGPLSQNLRFCQLPFQGRQTDDTFSLI